MRTSLLVARALCSASPSPSLCRVSCGRRCRVQLCGALRDVRRHASSSRELLGRGSAANAAAAAAAASTLPAIVDPARIKKALKAHSVAHVSGFVCFIMDCIFCKPRRTAKECDKLHINMVTGDYLCLQCGASGGWDQFEDMLSLPRARCLQLAAAAAAHKSAGGECGATAAASVARVWRSAVPVSAAAPKLVEDTLASLDLPGVTARSLQRLDISITDDGVLVAPSRLTSTSSTSSTSSSSTSAGDSVTAVRCLAADGRERSLPPGATSPARLIGWSTVRPADTQVTLVSRLIDAIALHHMCRTPVLLLPQGARYLSPQLLPWLERFKLIRLWFPGDAVSWSAVSVFAKKLHEKRCTAVRPSTELGSPVDALRAAVSAERVAAAGTAVSHESVTSFSTLRDSVLCELTNAKQVAGVQWVRMAALNKLLRGHRRGELTVFSGPTGAGKTTFISDYSLDLCMQGVNTLWGSFEINNTRLAKVMLTQYAGVSMEKNLKMFDQVADEFEKLPMWFMTFHGQNYINNVLDAMSHATYMHDIGHVVLDNLQFMMGAGGVDRFIEQDNVISKFRRFATMKNCHVTLVIHPRKERAEDELSLASIFGGVRATQEADNVIILQVLRTQDSHKKYLQVLKNRFSGDLGPLPLRFNKDSLSFNCGRLPRPRDTSLASSGGGGDSASSTGGGDDSAAVSAPQTPRRLSARATARSQCMAARLESLSLPEAVEDVAVETDVQQQVMWQVIDPVTGQQDDCGRQSERREHKMALVPASAKVLS